MATLALTRVKVTGNVGMYGGGIYSTGPLTMTDCVVSGNNANFDSNSLGGGVFLSGSGISATLVNVTISGNTATSGAGGIYIAGAMTLNLTNVTISGNTALQYGAMKNSNSATTHILNSTIANNHYSAGGNNGGIGNFASIDFKNTIVSGNDGTNCTNTGTLVSWGGNLDSGNTCFFIHPSDYLTINPLLGPLGENGGPTETMALLTGSVAIDGGTNTGCPSADQRGVLRPQDGNLNGVSVCDIGAFERCPNKPAHVEGTPDYYDLIGSAYAVINPSITIKTQMYEFSESLSFGQAKTVVLKGGYDCAFLANAGTYSAIKGSLTISNGTVIIENMKIK
jgi:parallel beta-helix repeat protein